MKKGTDYYIALVFASLRFWALWGELLVSSLSRIGVTMPERNAFGEFIALT